MDAWIHDGFLDSRWVLGFTMGFWVHDKVHVKSPDFFEPCAKAAKDTELGSSVPPLRTAAFEVPHPDWACHWEFCDCFGTFEPSDSLSYFCPFDKVWWVQMRLGNDSEAYGLAQFRYELNSSHVDLFRINVDDFHKIMSWPLSRFASHQAHFLRH